MAVGKETSQDASYELEVPQLNEYRNVNIWKLF